MIRYQITDGRIIDSTADYVQIRPGDSEMVRRAMSMRGGIVVNDRLDIALALGAAGVHLRSDFISPLEIRKMAPPGFLITVACHSREDVARAAGADFAIVSPVFAPLSKPAGRLALGIAGLREMCLSSSVPVIALGGITDANAPDCVAAGAVGIAGITLFAS